MGYKDATPEEINKVLEVSFESFKFYSRQSLNTRADLMRGIATELEIISDQAISTAHRETNLPEPRLRSEFKRTIYQLTSYADACERAEWMQTSIDTAIPDRNPPKPDIRKTSVPLGPVIVFGASNFPFAYSTAGGDTACALAAGCTVVVKAHPAHAETSELVALAIDKAVQKMHLPPGLFKHVHGASFEVGKALVMHKQTKAVGFTGSLQGGKALFDWANQRKEPIPVFAEMGSINPVFIFPGKLKDAASIAELYSKSITQSVGQFCTNPGLLIAIQTSALETFINHLGNAMKKTEPAKMLHKGIYTSYIEKRKSALAQEGVELLATADEEKDEYGNATLATATAEAFLNNPVLHHEVFGPYSIIIRCKDKNEMLQVVNSIEGQLTATIMATDEDVQEHEEIIERIRSICGRFIYNGVPTGVEVCQSMHHGGPFPATTDSRFTSVGADGIKRFVRPVAYQNWPDHLLPMELRDDNPYGIYRTVNNELTKNKVKR